MRQTKQSNMDNSPIGDSKMIQATPHDLEMIHHPVKGTCLLRPDMDLPPMESA
jgi:hypothetical protein